MRTALIALILTTSFARAQSDQQLVTRYDGAVAAQNYTAALATARTITTRYPDSAVWQFNLASMLARQLNTDEPDPTILSESLDALQRAAELGYTGIRSFEHSEDLDPLRNAPRFTKALKTVQANAAARLNDFINEARDHTPETYTPKALPESPALILALHGTGMKGTHMIQALKDTADQLNMLLIAPDALRPVTGGYSWTYRDESEWLIQHTIEQAITEHHIDPSQIYLVGFSQGANIALILGQTHPDLFAGIIPICAHYEPQTAEPQDGASLPPYYLLTGARDPWKKTYTAAKKDLTQANTPVQIRILPAQGHELPAGKLGTNEFVKAIKWCQTNPKSERQSQPAEPQTPAP